MSDNGQARAQRNRRSSILRVRQPPDPLSGLDPLRPQPQPPPGPSRRVSFQNIKHVQQFEVDDHAPLVGSPIREKIQDTVSSDGILSPGRALSASNSSIKTPTATHIVDSRILASLSAQPTHYLVFDSVSERDDGTILSAKDMSMSVMDTELNLTHTVDMESRAAGQAGRQTPLIADENSRFFSTTMQIFKPPTGQKGENREVLDVSAIAAEDGSDMQMDMTNANENSKLLATMRIFAPEVGKMSHTVAKESSSDMQVERTSPDTVFVEEDSRYLGATMQIFKPPMEQRREDREVLDVSAIAAEDGSDMQMDMTNADENSKLLATMRIFAPEVGNMSQTVPDTVAKKSSSDTQVERTNADNENAEALVMEGSKLLTTMHLFKSPVEQRIEDETVQNVSAITAADSCDMQINDSNVEPMVAEEAENSNAPEAMGGNFHDLSSGASAQIANENYNSPQNSTRTTQKSHLESPGAVPKKKTRLPPSFRSSPSPSPLALTPSPARSRYLPPTPSPLVTSRNTTLLQKSVIEENVAGVRTADSVTRNAAASTSNRTSIVSNSSTTPVVTNRSARKSLLESPGVVMKKKSRMPMPMNPTPFKPPTTTNQRHNPRLNAEEERMEEEVQDENVQKEKEEVTTQDEPHITIDAIHYRIKYMKELTAHFEAEYETKVKLLEGLEELRREKEKLCLDVKQTLGQASVSLSLSQSISLPPPSPTSSSSSTPRPRQHSSHHYSITSASTS